MNQINQNNRWESTNYRKIYQSLGINQPPTQSLGINKLKKKLPHAGNQPSTTQSLGINQLSTLSNRWESTSYQHEPHTARDILMDFIFSG